MSASINLTLPLNAEDVSAALNAGAQSLSVAISQNLMQDVVNTGSVYQATSFDTDYANQELHISGKSDFFGNYSKDAPSTQVQQSTSTQTTWNQVFNQGQFDPWILIQEPALVLAVAVVLQMIIPIPKSLKLEGLATIFTGLSRKVNRPGISDSQRAFAGFFLPTLILFVVMFLVFTLDIVSDFDYIVSLVVMFLVLDLKFVQDRSVHVYRALHEGFKDKAKDLLSTMVLRETAPLSEMGIAKACSESAILRIFSGWFAVMVWYFIAGIEGATLMQTINIMSRSFNYKLKGNYRFGRPIFIVHQIMLFIPAVVLMFMLIFSKNPIRHVVCGFDAFSRYPAAVSGLVLGAVGGALNITLGGPRYYQGEISRLPKVGGELSPDRQSILYSMRKIRMCGLILLVLSVVIDLNM